MLLTKKNSMRLSVVLIFNSNHNDTFSFDNLLLLIFVCCMFQILLFIGHITIIKLHILYFYFIFSFIPVLMCLLTLTAESEKKFIQNPLFMFKWRNSYWRVIVSTKGYWRVNYIFNIHFWLSVWRVSLTIIVFL